MKKTFALILALVLTLSLAACGGGNNNGGNSTTDNNSTPSATNGTSSTPSATNEPESLFLNSSELVGTKSYGDANSGYHPRLSVYNLGTTVSNGLDQKIYNPGVTDNPEEIIPAVETGYRIICAKFSFSNEPTDKTHTLDGISWSFYTDLPEGYQMFGKHGNTGTYEKFTWEDISQYASDQHMWTSDLLRNLAKGQVISMQFLLITPPGATQPVNIHVGLSTLKPNGDITIATDGTISAVFASN